MWNPPSVLGLVWAHQGVLVFNVEPLSVLFLVWGHCHTGFRIGGRDMGRLSCEGLGLELGIILGVSSFIFHGAPHPPPLWKWV